MSELLIRGGIPLCGELRAGANKNAILPMIAAALLTEETVTLENVPDIGDVRSMIRLAEGLGAGIVWEPRQGRLEVSARAPLGAELERSVCREVRAGILFAAPLLHRNGRAVMSPPGGDVIGRRRLDAHFDGLRTLGADIRVRADFEFHARQPLQGGDIFLPESSVTATEQVLLGAVLARGRTTVGNAASEPHVQDVGRLLIKMGAKIDGLGTNRLVIEGVAGLHGAHHRVGADHAEVGSFLALAAATGGELAVTGIDPNHYRMIARTFARLGVELQFTGDAVSVKADQCRRVDPGLTGGIPVVDDGPWPHFPSDLMSIMIVLATQVEGTVLFFEKMYESRMYFVDRLVAMGAHAVICDPHRVVISGPARLHGIELSSPDIRAGMALLGAALCAQGESLIRNVRHIDRGYVGIEERLRALGGDVVRR